MKIILYYLAPCFLVLSSFSVQKTGNCRRSGITGHVYLVTGNQMPSPDRPPSSPPGLKTILYVYELTNAGEAVKDVTPGFYRSVPTRLVKEIETEDDGFFKVKLKPGRYSLFVKKGDLLFSSVSDDKNNIHPVEVVRGKMTEEDFRVNYNAVY